MNETAEFAPKPRPRVVSVADQPRVAEPIDDRVQRAMEQLELTPPTDIEYVANNMDRLRHLDLGKMWDEMFGTEMPKDRAEGMTKMATWAAANKTKVQQ